MKAIQPTAATCSFLNSSVTPVQSANLGATQCSVLPPQLWAFWASSYKKQHWSWTPVARCPSWLWIWLTAPHSGWWHKGQHLCQDTQSSFTVHSTRFGYRQLQAAPRPSPPVLSWFCSPSAPCTYTWVTTCGYPRKELQHLIFGLSCISSLLQEGQFSDFRQKYVWILKVLEDWLNTSWTRTRRSVSNLYFPRKTLQMLVWCFMVSIL